MFDCQQISRLVAESKVRKLTFRERAELVFHTLMCSPCRGFAKMQRLIDRVIHSKAAEDADQSNGHQLDAAGRKRVSTAVSAAIDSDAKDDV